MDCIAFTKVKLPYGWLGNMSPHGMTVDNLYWRTAEALFQASRFADDNPVREIIRSQPSPMGAKMAAKAHADQRIIKPCSTEDLSIMYSVLVLKLASHPALKEELIATGDRIIIEDCTNRQHGSGLFWGAALQKDGSWKGDNHLGKLWMNIRAALDKPKL